MGSVVLCSGGLDKTPVDTVDIWELEHVQCPKSNEEVLGQVIWWRLERHDGKSDYYVADWILDKYVPRPERINGWWVATFRDKNGVRRTVRARVFEETWTYADLEQIDRMRLPAERRSGLKQYDRGK